MVDGNDRAVTAGSDLHVEWWAPSNVILPTNVTVTVPELPPGHYAIHDGWMVRVER